jgi:putative SOS response-associated peptidase YedK
VQMSGRYTLFKINNFFQRFGLADDSSSDLKRSYNISPTQIAPVILERDGQPVLQFMKWGFIPRGAKNANSVFRYKTYEARSEGVFSKATWGDSVRHKRCLVPANGFYIWESTPEGKKPYYALPTDQELFAFAGVYSSWVDPEGKEWGTFAVVTTESNDDIAAIGDRMPIILQPQDEKRWLDSSATDINTIYDLMRPYSNGNISIVPVGNDINSTKIDNPKLIAPIK